MVAYLESRSKRKILIVGAVALIFALFIWGFVADWKQRASDRERIATAQGIARVVDAVFRERSELKVATLSGKIDVRSVNEGAIVRDRELRGSRQRLYEHAFHHRNYGTGDAEGEPSSEVRRSTTAVKRSPC